MCVCSHSQHLVKYTEKLSGKVKLVSIYIHRYFSSSIKSYMNIKLPGVCGACRLPVSTSD